VTIDKAVDAVFGGVSGDVVLEDAAAKRKVSALLLSVYF
jgi:hypothetical protein